MAGAHWDAYKAYCVKNRIPPNRAAVPETEQLDKEGRFLAQEFVNIAACLVSFACF